MRTLDLPLPSASPERPRRGRLGMAALAAAFVLPLAAGGCSGLDETEQRVLSGGAIGATVGTVGTAVTGGCVACGAAIGGAVGAGAGYLSDKIKLDDD